VQCAVPTTTTAATTTTTAAAAVSPNTANQLPRTGNNVGPTIVAALTLLGLGAALILLARRRRLVR
jgi:LPXTG-motif cell wall-anchored protein